MQTTRKQRVPMSEQIRLITECRRSGMTKLVPDTIKFL